MRVGTLYAVLRLEKGQFEAALATSQTKFGAFMKVIRASALLAAQGLAVVAAGSLAMAASFQQHMNQALAIMGDVSAGMRAKMEAAARAVAKTSTFSANQAADAFYYLASAGFTAKQSIGALPVVAEFAQAGVMDLEKATELLMDAQTTMGLRSKDATTNMRNMARVSDVLSAAQIHSNATLQQMAEALTNKAGPSLRLLGKDVEEGAAALMVLANRGVKGRAAGTALSIVLRDLQTRAIKNKDAWDEMGLSVFNAHGNMRNMADILAGLEKRFKGMSDEEVKTSLLTLGFTDRSVNFLQTMMGSSKQLREYERLLHKAGGTTHEVAQKQLGTFINQLVLLWHKIQDVALTIGKHLLPPLTEVVKAIGRWLDENGKLISSIVTGIMGALGTFFNMLFRVIDAIGKFLDQHELLQPLLLGIAAVVAAAVVPAFAAWAAATLVAVAPILALVAAATAIIYVLDQMGVLWPIVNKAVEAAGDVMDWVSANVLPALSDALGWIAEQGAPIVAAALQVLTNEVFPMLGGIVTWFTEQILPKLVDLFSMIVEDAVPAFAAIFDFVANEVVPRIGSAIGWFSENVLPVLEEAFGAVVSWVIDNWPTISSIVGQVLGAVGEAFKVASEIIAVVVPIIWGIVEPIGRVLFAALGIAASVLLGAIDVAFKAIGGVFDTFHKVARHVYEAVTGLWDGMSDFFGGVWEGIQGAFKAGINVVIGLVNGFIGFLNNIHIDIPKIDAGPIQFGGGSIDPFNIPTVPYLAKGARNFRGGLAVVGERGPELAYLPSGTDVIPANRTASILEGVGKMEVTIRDGDGALRAGGYSQQALQRAVTQAVEAVVMGARHRSIRMGTE